MKTILSLYVFFYSAFTFACPDISGTFAGWCQQENSCYGTQPRYYGMEIKQNSCSEVKITYISTLGPILETNYLVDTPTDILSEKSNIRQWVSYTNDGLVKTEMFGSDLNAPAMTVIENLKKVTNSSGNYLDINSEGKTPNCTFTVKCQIPAI